jgi:hypothetical protein
MRAALAALVVLLGAGAAQAQTTPILAADFSITGCSGVAYGFNGSCSEAGHGTIFQRTENLTGGPTGGPYLRLSWIANGGDGCTTGNCEGYVGMGNGGAPEGAVAQGSARYWRIWMRVPAGFNATAEPDGNRWGGKMIIYSDGNPDRGRIIWNFQAGDTTSTYQFVIRVNTGCQVPTYCADASDDLILYNLPTDNQWHAYQLKIQSGTTDSSIDGRLSLYVDGDITTNTPTAQSNLVSIPTTGWGSNNVRWGSYFEYLQAGGTAAFDTAKVELDDQFDAAWYTAMGGAPSSTPRRSPFRKADLGREDRHADAR